MKKKNYFLKLILLVFVSILMSNVSKATTRSVTNTLDTGAGSLRDAIDNSIDGDSIVFDNSINGIPIVLTSYLDVDVAITIIGNDTSNTILSGDSLSQIMRISDSVLIEGVQFYKGAQFVVISQMGGAIHVATTGYLTVKNCLFDQNGAKYGGAIAARNAAGIDASYCVFRNSIGDGTENTGGGAISIYFSSGISRFTNCSFINNIHNISNGNQRSGGAMFLNGGDITIKNCEFIGNAVLSTSHNSEGGAIYALASNSFFQINLTIEGCLFEDNECTSTMGTKGGALNLSINELYAKFSISKSKFKNNHCTSTGNAISYGGAIYARTVELQITTTDFEGNSVSTNGAVSSTAYGGAVYSEGVPNLKIANSSFHLNTATSNNQIASGGALCTSNSTDTLNLENNTFYGNQTIAAGNSRGGAIYTVVSYNYLTNNTIANNSCTGTNLIEAGGLHLAKVSSERYLYNNLIADNVANSGNFDDVRWGTPGAFSKVNNLVENSEVTVTWAYSTNPGLDPAGIKNNGGLTPTVALMAGGNPIDNGDIATSLPLDQRSAARVGNPDIGAFEFGGCANTYSNFSEVNCGSYTVPSTDETYTTIGTYTVTDTIPNACLMDSIMTIDVTILTPLSGSVMDTICYSDSIVINGTTYNQSNPNGTETFTNVGPFMCDSTVTVNLSFTTFNDLDVMAIEDTICYGASTSIQVDTTEMNVNYVLRDDATDLIVDGPIVGNGGSITFNTGVLTNTTSYNINACSQGSALLLDNNDDRVDVTPAVPLSGSFSVMGWIKTTVNSASSGKIMTWAAASGISLYTQFELFFGRIRYYSLNTNANASLVWSNVMVNDGNWHHFAITKDGSTDSVSIYVDGILDITDYAPHIYNNFATTSVGQAWVNNLFFGNMDGSVDELSVWNTNVNLSQVQSAMSNGLTGTEPNLEAYYDFEEGAGSAMIDKSANGYNGTLINMDTVNAWVEGISSTPCKQEMSTIVTVNVLPLKTGSVNSTICNEDSVVVNGTTYNASNPTGTEVFTNVGSNMCDSTVTINLNVLPALVGSVTNTICNEDSVVVNGTTYNASNPTGTEVFTNVGPNMCDSTVTINLNVLPAIDTSTTVNGSMITSNQTGATYEWIDCSTNTAIVPAETGQSYTAVSNGNYAVVVTVGACSDTSACVAIMSVGINEENSFQNINIYPNPTQAFFTIKLNQIDNGLVNVYNVLGELVFTNQLVSTETSIDLRNSEKGIYFVQISNGGETITRRVIKN